MYRVTGSCSSHLFLCTLSTSDTLSAKTLLDYSEVIIWHNTHWTMKTMRGLGTKPVLFNIVPRLLPFLVGNKAKGELHLRDSDFALLLQIKQNSSSQVFFLWGEFGTKVLASSPGFLFQILPRDFSPKLQDKIRNGKPGFEATKTLLSVNT